LVLLRVRAKDSSVGGASRASRLRLYRQTLHTFDTLALDFICDVSKGIAAVAPFEAELEKDNNIGLSEHQELPPCTTLSLKQEFAA